MVDRLVSKEVISKSIAKCNSKAWLTTDFIIHYIINVIIPYTKDEFSICCEIFHCLLSHSNK